VAAVALEPAEDLLALGRVPGRQRELPAGRHAALRVELAIFTRIGAAEASVTVARKSRAGRRTGPRRMIVAPFRRCYHARDGAPDGPRLSRPVRTIFFDAGNTLLR